MRYTTALSRSLWPGMFKYRLEFQTLAGGGVRFGCLKQNQRLDRRTLSMLPTNTPERVSTASASTSSSSSSKCKASGKTTKTLGAFAAASVAASGIGLSVAFSSAEVAGTGGIKVGDLTRRSFTTKTARNGNKIIVPEKMILYQYEVCPFCNKVKAFLEYNDINYERVEVNPLSKKEIAFSDYKMVPFAVIDGVQVNGSADIIRYLSPNENSKSRDEEEEKWTRWVDDHLVHLLPPNIYRTPSESLQSFNYITSQSNFTYWQKLSARYAGAFIMFMVAKKTKTKYNVGDPRKDLYTAVEYWTQEGLKERNAVFHGGNEEPDISDLSVYGVLRSIEGSYDTWDDLRGHDWPDRELFWSWWENISEKVKVSN
uniref:Prostaglandin E synthase 2 n=1 Tax=Aplanochytrium stocchinoi TaxID=215587 RepID=A0A7S3PJH7_9STRA